CALGLGLYSYAGYFDVW
nr:immunoglobulin heavy chain junction region [Mus musculus]